MHFRARRKIILNIYDFDGTIYDGDSSIDFYRFCFVRSPFSVLRCLPGFAAAAVKYKLGHNTKTEMKSAFFAFVSGFEDISDVVSAFWAKHMNKIEPWYLQQQRPDDLIISASPDFLLAEICHLLGIQNLIASHADPHTGRYLEENCYGPHKVTLFQGKFPGAEVDAFYSDSSSDAPMAALAKESYLVQKGTVTRWK